MTPTPAMIGEWVCVTLSHTPGAPGAVVYGMLSDCSDDAGITIVDRHGETWHFWPALDVELVDSRHNRA